MANMPQDVGKEAIQTKGWIGAHKWLILRRISQLGILAAFVAGPWFGLWIVKGNLASSLTLDTLPLTDPHILLQAMISGVTPETTAIVGAIIVLVFYALVGGRVYCSWVCPVNMVTDAAAWLRRKLGIRGSSHASRSTRYWVLALTLILPLITGGIVWELVNPVSIMFRGIVFSMGLAWVLILAIFLFDLLVSRDGWCGHYCPVGAFYSLLSNRAVVRVAATNREACDDCMDCFNVCPEPQVIKPALKGAPKGIGPVIVANQCTNCGRCIDVCAVNVFQFGNRYSNQSSSGLHSAKAYSKHTV
ncbi:MAG TPA: quinol dehydrogenase ferredoxin subunit NapH [Thiolapillus brandeum]|uniref:Quinol dehydrogenase ferredoxin subunit NapH n=1 Tax=Thiolapillus brandeum TaxID=1076588 RepID=A0A831W9Z0_9GAMM|nr:quinol dehydrogenase ferredoxin subunit NapH [Thiolapillus brandeum]